MSGPELVTFGCRLNIAESEAMRVAAAAHDDLVIVNSCAVTAEAVRQGARAIRRAARARPDARIVVTGCAAQIEPARFAAMPEVAAVIGNADKRDPASFASGGPRVRVSDLLRVSRLAPQLAAAFAGHARAFVEVQNGCDHACTFCVIPQGRGASRALPIAQLVETIARLVDAGHREVVLTGVDLTSWRDGEATLGTLCAAVLRGVPALARLRLGSLDPVEIDDALFDLLAHEPRMMPHLHLSLQHGADLILKRMRRRHLRADALRLIDRLKAARRDIAIGADLIAGFPTETAAHHAANLSLIGAADIVFGHVFPYSPRDLTPAARMPQHARETIRVRAAELRAVAETRRAAWLAQLVGTVQQVLIERDGRSGHAENFAKVRLADPLPASPALRRPSGSSDLEGSRAHLQDPGVRRDDERANRILPVRIAAVDGDALLGTPA